MRGSAFRKVPPPHPRPLSPEYWGEGSKQPLSKDRSRQWLVDAVGKARGEHLFHVWAYVIMPEHAHFLLWPTQPVYDISDVLKAIKQSVTQKALLYVKSEARWFLPAMADRQPSGEVSHRFWQRGGGYDRNLFEPKAIWMEIDYLHANPVRRALCEKPEDWYWSSAADHAGVRQGPLRIDKVSLPLLPIFDRDRGRMAQRRRPRK